MFKSPFSKEVAFVLLELGATDAADIYPEELALLSAQAAPKRRLEFCNGRKAVHQAFKKLGENPAPAILRGSNREPLWPAGYVGSLSHCNQHAVAAVAKQTDSIQSIGIDLEHLKRSSRYDISEKIAHPEELSWIRAIPECQQRRCLSIFSAKESIYKALYPFCRRYIDFKEVSLHWNDTEDVFKGTLLSDISDEYGTGFEITISCSYTKEYVLCACVVT